VAEKYFTPSNRHGGRIGQSGQIATDHLVELLVGWDSNEGFEVRDWVRTGLDVMGVIVDFDLDPLSIFVVLLVLAHCKPPNVL
jgi:hypothetical protein